MEIFEMLLNSLSWIFILAGSFLMVLGAIGILRFRGFWARLHAASVIESGGMIFLLAGMCLQAGDLRRIFKLALIGLFLFSTGPTSTHALASAALLDRSKPKREAK